MFGHQFLEIVFRMCAKFTDEFLGNGKMQCEAYSTQIYIQHSTEKSFFA